MPRTNAQTCETNDFEAPPPVAVHTQCTSRLFHVDFFEDVNDSYEHFDHVGIFDERDNVSKLRHAYFSLEE